MHKRGIVHRDLKPENVMVDDDDRIKLIDFGIAMNEDARRLTFVNVSSMLGTPDYISPEQVQGKRGDQRSDMYSLGRHVLRDAHRPGAVQRTEPAGGDERPPGEGPRAPARAECRRFRRRSRRLSFGPWNATRATATPVPMKWSGTSSTRSRWVWRTAAIGPRAAARRPARQGQQAHAALCGPGPGADRAVRVDADAGEAMSAPIERETAIILDNRILRDGVR